MVQHSGLQKQVLALYKKSLQIAKNKEGSGAQGTVEFVRQKFRDEVCSISL